MSGASRIEMLPEKANSENARACVLGVLISLIMVRMVTVLPEKTPDRQRKSTICHIEREKPKSVLVIARPNKLCMSSGLRPSYSVGDENHDK